MKVLSPIAGDEEAEDGEVEGAGLSGPRRRQPAHDANPSATLEEWEALNVKKFDLAFAVDPLFHKTSAQFDEGGARGEQFLAAAQQCFPVVAHTGWRCASDFAAPSSCAQRALAETHMTTGRCRPVAEQPGSLPRLRHSVRLLRGTGRGHGCRHARAR